MVIWYNGHRKLRQRERMRERRGRGGRRRAAGASKGQSLEALKGQERLKWERCSMCLESEGQEAVMGMNLGIGRARL